MSDFRRLAVARKAKPRIWFCVVGGLLLSACTTTEPREDHYESLVLRAVPLPAPLARVPEPPVAPPVLKATKSLDLPDTPAQEPVDLEPDPARNVFFSLGSAEISDKARATIRNIAEMLKEHRNETVILVGGTDGLGSREFCIAISSKRTDALEAELLKLGVRPIQLRKRLRGCEVASRQTCNSEACRHRRRRVEIQLAE